MDPKDKSEGTINLVNSLHSRLKSFFHRFVGVSTRRLAGRGETESLMVNQIGRGTYKTTWCG